MSAAKAPKSLEAQPAWFAAWKALSGGRGPDAIPSIEIAVRSRHPFVVVAFGDAGSAVLLSTDIEKIGDMRYRFHEARVGPEERGGVTAKWALEEADCGLRRLRRLAWAGFDAEMRKKYGVDTNSIGTPFETPTPGTPDEITLAHVCGASRLIASKRVVMSDLAAAIAAYRWLFEGDDAAAKGLHDAEDWREAYAQACTVYCAPSDHEEPVGSRRRGSHT